MSACPQCGLSNFPNIAACRRCGAALLGGGGFAPPPIAPGAPAWHAPEQMARRSAATSLYGVGTFYLFILFCFYGWASKNAADPVGTMLIAAAVLVPPAGSGLAAGYLFTKGSRSALGFAILPLGLLALLFPIGTRFAFRVYRTLRPSIDQANLG